MPVVEVDRTKPFTKETGFAIYQILGLTDAEVKEIVPPEKFDEYMAWATKNKPDTTSELLKHR